jgi:hypothetical protein
VTEAEVAAIDPLRRRSRTLDDTSEELLAVGWALAITTSDSAGSAAEQKPDAVGHGRCLDPSREPAWVAMDHRSDAIVS